MPSMSKFDSLMEPYDEFHTGLKFPDYEDSSRADTFNILNAAANNLDTDEEVDDLPYETDGISQPMQGSDAQSKFHIYSLLVDKNRTLHKNGVVYFVKNFVSNLVCSIHNES